jgi:hypothetical protein
MLRHDTGNEDYEGGLQILNTAGSSYAAIYRIPSDPLTVELSGGSSLYLHDPMTAGIWHWMAFTQSGTSVLGYSMALGDSSLTTDSSLAATFDLDELWLYGLDGDYYQDVSMAGVKVWSGVALTQAELENEIWSFYPKQQVDSLWGWYPMPGPVTETSTIHDWSGNGHTLTRNGKATDPTTYSDPPISWGGRSHIYVPAEAGAALVPATFTTLRLFRDVYRFRAQHVQRRVLIEEGEAEAPTTKEVTDVGGGSDALAALAAAFGLADIGGGVDAVDIAASITVKDAGSAFILTDTYNESNQDGWISFQVSIPTKSRAAQEFTGDGGVLSQAKFYIQKVNSPTGDLTAHLYLSDEGSPAKPTGSVLATSKVVAETSIPAGPSLVEFDFEDGFVLADGTDYFISVEYTGTAGGSDYTRIGMDSSSPTHSGNGAEYYSGAWSAQSYDVCFYVNTATVATETVDVEAAVAVDVTDTGTGTEVVDVSAEVDVADAGSGVEVVDVPEVSAGVTDVGSGADAIEVPEVSAGVTDVGSGADAIEVPEVSAGVTDAGSGADVVQAGAIVDVTDAGAGADVIDVEAAVDLADAGAGGDAVDVGAEVDVTDAGAGADAVDLEAAVDVSDAGAGADAVDVPEVTAEVTDTGAGAEVVDVPEVSAGVTDEGSGADALDIKATVDVTDAGTGTDVVDSLILIPVTDVGSGADAVDVDAAVDLADVGSGDDAVDIEAAVDVADVGGGVDEVDSLILIPVTDVGSGVETVDVPEVSAGVTETGTGADEISDLAVSLGVTDAGAGADVVPGPGAAVPIADSATGVDALAQLLANILVTDLGSGADQLSDLAATVSISDLGGGLDALTIAVSLSVSDSGTGTEEVTKTIQGVLKSVSDLGGGVESISVPTVSLSVSEVGTGAEVVTITTSFVVSDVGGAVDAVTVLKALLKQVTDAGTGSDQATIEVSLSIADVGTGTELIQPITVGALVTDTGAGGEQLDIDAFVPVVDLGAGADAVTTITDVVTTDQAPDSVGIRDIINGVPAAGVKLGNSQEADFIQWADAAALITVLDYDASGNLEYLGRGKPGAQAYQAAWQVQRFYYDGEENLIEVRIPSLPADPGVSDAGLVHIYDDRETLTYPTLRA